MGSTRLSLPVFGRHFGGDVSLELCDLARLGASGGDSRSTLVMKGSPVRVRASALSKPAANGGFFSSRDVNRKAGVSTKSPFVSTASPNATATLFVP